MRDNTDQSMAEYRAGMRPRHSARIRRHRAERPFAYVPRHANVTDAYADGMRADVYRSAEDSATRALARVTARARADQPGPGACPCPEGTSRWGVGDGICYDADGMAVLSAGCSHGR